MTKEQLDIVLDELEAQFPGYYPNARWTAGTLTETITALNGSTYFDETNNKLYTFTTIWDTGVAITTNSPKIDPVNSDMWFDETLDLLHEYFVIWDAGESITDTIPVTPFPIGTKWFDESINTLYTAITADTWTGATELVIQDIQPQTPAVDEQWFDENTNLLYTCTVSDWDAGTPTDTITAVSGSTYFDETNNKFYTFTTVWDAGTVLPTSEISNPIDTNRWFDELLDLLFTYVDDAGWLELTQVAAIILANNENIYPDKTLQVNFDDTYELVYLRKGAYNSEGIFIEDRITTVLDYRLVTGIEMYRKERMKSAYKIGKQI